MSPVFCVVGPTASGKSHLALGLAKGIGGVIINADSLQVYKGLPLLTARPSPQDEAHVSHHLYGFLGPHDTYSVARWLEDVAPLLARLIPEGRPVIFVGGTGLYIKALLEGLAPVPVIDPDTRTRVRALYESQGFEALQELWGEIGEEVLGPCPKDPQRAQRALEVYLATQRPLAFWQQTPQQPLAPNAKIIYAVRPKGELLERAQARLEAVFDPSRQEMEGLMIDHPNLETAPLMQALGAKELLALVQGTMSRAEALTQAFIRTRQYIKRQNTWFRHQLRDPLVLDPQRDMAHIIEEITRHNP